MYGLLAANRAILFDFHLFGVLALIAGSDIIFLTADAASEDNIFSCHAIILLIFFILRSAV